MAVGYADGHVRAFELLVARLTGGPPFPRVT
jgi:hypothetical protein